MGLMHYEVENKGNMMRKPKSMMNLNELDITIIAYYHFNFLWSYSESSRIWANLFKKAERDPIKRILHIRESSSCSPNFLGKK